MKKLEVQNLMPGYYVWRATEERGARTSFRGEVIWARRGDVFIVVYDDGREARITII